ncbi:MAG: hypothetical protein MGG37_11690 [Trichodesmium sp. MAG_R01]|nr:hypothetical protein [Trichodesmium sp. MAG_R01]
MTEQKMVGLFTVYNCKNSHPKGDVIFVHGLAGHPWATWHPQNQSDNTNIDFWPFWLGETLLDKKIDVNIWSFGYEAPGFKYFGQGMSRFDQASNLLKYLEVHHIGDRPFIFVAHSLGGLIVKEVIRSAQNFPQYQTIIEQVQGIVFLSTPHTGAHLTNLIQNISFLTRPTVNIKELQEHSPELRHLNEWYRQNVDKLGIKTKAFRATKPMNGILVVDEDSSNPGLINAKTVPVSKNHISIAKPEKSDLVYLSTIKFCEEVFPQISNSNNDKDNFIRKEEDESLIILNTRLPYKLPGLSRDELNIALENVSAWKKVHTSVEHLYSQFLLFDEQIIRCEEVVKKGDYQLQQLYINKANDFINFLRTPFNRFVSDIEKLPKQVLNNNIIILLSNLFIFYNGLRRCLGSTLESNGFENLKDVTQRIRSLLLHSLHIADQILEEYFRIRGE